MGISVGRVARLRAQLILSYLGLTGLVAGTSWISGAGVGILPLSVGAVAAVALGALLGRRSLEPLEQRVIELEADRDHLEEEVSARYRNDLAVRRAEKMEVIGRVSGALAHEFNDTLSIVLGYTGIALEGLHNEDPMYHPLSEIKQAGERSADLTRRLLAMGRSPHQEATVIDVVATVDKMGRSIRRVLGESRDLKISSETAPCRILAVRGQIEQMVMNLVVNARDAMPNGGMLSLDVQRVDVTPEQAAREVGLAPGRHVRIRLRDTGIGMTPEIQEHLFEPFFTTKRRETASGLGLATVFGLVRQQGGYIGVRSAVGEGTTFEIFLPEAVPLASKQEVPSSGATRAARTILVVEDEEQLRVVVERILSRHRYGVLVAGSQREAMSIAQAHPGKIDLLVTDVATSEIDGQVLAEQLLEHRPEMKVLYLSGHVPDALAPREEKSEAQDFLQKPVTPDALRQKVRGMLLSPSSIPPSHRGNA